LQAAGTQRLALPAGVRALNVDCLGQIGPSLVLKAFEKGADGVMLVGCLPEECHYEFGSRRAAEGFEETRALACILGFGDEQLEFIQLGADQAEVLIGKVRDFVDRLAARRAVGNEAQAGDTRPAEKGVPVS
jgi:heterodisulfide reductase subunit A/F420-non-reducing hydrogenase iron-sulfur subunit